MTFTGRIRVFLIAVAVLPPLLVMIVIYFRSVRQIDRSDQQQAQENLSRFSTTHDQFRDEILENVERLRSSPDLSRTVMQLQPGRLSQLELAPHTFGLNFIELLDSSLRVQASAHRPGLLGEPAHVELTPAQVDTAGLLRTVEIDIDGRHGSYTAVRRLAGGRYLYTGRYIDNRYLRQLGELLNAAVAVQFSDDPASDLAAMRPGALYEREGRYQAVLDAGGGFYLLADFATGVERPLFMSLLRITGLVAVGSVLVAIGLGLYITGRAKREIENLVQASSRVAAGDFSTPVMAYEEGEFAQLADSFTDMMVKLKAIQRQLSTTEKIAAWQALGRKVAHEIKNPLTPIAISVDDLRRSYHEQLPKFDQILEETTGTIKGEVHRMTRLLEQFVSFARMNPPTIKRVRLESLLDAARMLYGREAAMGRLRLSSDSKRGDIRVDPDAFKQVLINLIKNGLEAAPDSTVTVAVTDDADQIVICIEDSGPGFTDERLDNSFEPYVSTKKDGSGLGLVICYRIVHDHGGTIDLYNRKEGGAGVIIRLPA